MGCSSIGGVRPAALALVLALVSAPGCKVNYSFTGANIPPDARTISVDLFTALAPLATPLTAQVFTETLRDLLLAQTPLQLAREQGDLHYEGAIIAYDVQPVSVQADETAALNRLTITVRMNYYNNLDPEKNSESTFSRFADYDSSQDLVAVEEALTLEVSKQIAQDIFDRTLGDW